MNTVEKQLDYWQEQLEGIEPINLPVDRPRSAGKGQPDSRFTFKIERDLADKVIAFSSERGLPLSSTLLAVFKVLLFRCTNQTNICVLAAINKASIIRTDFDNEPSFDELAADVNQKLIHGSQYELSFETLLINQLLGIAFIFRDKTNSRPNIRWNNFELVFDLSLRSDGLYGDVDYCSNLWNITSINRLRSLFLELLHSVVKDSTTKVGKLNMLRSDERYELLEQFSGHDVDYPHDITIVDLLSGAAKRFSSSIAVRFEGESLTYRELDERSNRLAHYLRSLGVKADTLVPICIDRGVEMIIAMIGILKAGGAYVPIDPDYPSERIEFILGDVASNVIVTNGKVYETILPFATSAHIVTLDRDNEKILEFTDRAVITRSGPHNLAYVIYTSGSTGYPKGVCIEHRSVVRLFENDEKLYDFDEKDVWTMFHSFCFDFSVWEMYGALFYGGCLIVVPKEIARDAISFGELIVREKVTVLNQTPSAFYVLQEYLAMGTTDIDVRYVIFGGEALTPSRLKPWRKRFADCRLVNMYGITETTVHVTFQELNENHLNDTVNIVGRPIPTLRVYILDKYLEPVPIGVEGEIYVEGPGVARGYLNREDLSRQRFIPDKFGSGRLYKSGDLGRWTENGDIEYLGRGDEQVKINGFRIEPAEIEHVLESSGMLNQAVVLVKKESSGTQRLIAFVSGAETIEQSKVQSFLSKKIPQYMVPSHIIRVKHFPLTVNGKVDKRRLLSKEFTTR